MDIIKISSSKEQSEKKIKKQFSFKTSKTSTIHGMKDLMLLRCQYCQSKLQIQCDLYQNVNSLFADIETPILPFTWDFKRP